MNLPTTMFVLVMSIATWCLFYAIGMPLESKETAAVVGIWALLAYGARAARRRMRSGGGPKQ